MTPTEYQTKYASLARSLADTLMVWARDRRTEDQKQAGALQHDLCQIRRAELAEPAPDEKGPGE
jgi:hypothetical protein